MPAEIMTDESTALSYTTAEMKRRRPSGKKVYKPHMATKVKWALEDCMNKAVSAQQTMRAMLVWMEEEWGAVGTDDPPRLRHLAQLEHLLTTLALDVVEIERITARAVAESKLG
jgi:hypothetical protein